MRKKTKTIRVDDEFAYELGIFANVNGIEMTDATRIIRDWLKKSRINKETHVWEVKW